MTPTAPMDPIHEISEVVNGPLNNCVLSEANLGMDGATLKQIYYLRIEMHQMPF